MTAPTIRSAWWTLLFIAGLVRAQETGINLNGALPNSKALLDLDVSGTLAGNPYRGLLIPRMTYAERLTIPVSTLTNVDQALLVYQIDDGPAADPTLASSMAHGYWYYEYYTPGNVLNRWVRWGTSISSWTLAGNGNTVATTNYLGTPTGSNDDLYIGTTSSTLVDPAFRINDSYNGGVAINSPTAAVERLEVNGGVKVGTTVLNSMGAIRFDGGATTIPNRWHYGNVDGTATGWKRLENAERVYTNEAYRDTMMICPGVAGERIVGTYDGTPVASTAVIGPMHTPFMTNTGAGNRQGYRVQYIYPAAELLAMGLCPGLITKFSFYALTSDGAGCAANVNCPDLKVDIRMGNTALGTFGPPVNSQGTAIVAPNVWDATTEASANIYPTSATAMLVQSGWIDFPIAGAGFNWTGGNLVIDVSWQRAATIGSSPSVQLEEALPYTATKWVQVTNSFSFAHGNTYQDEPLTANATTGTTNTRPVTRFFGPVKSQVYEAADQTASFINYGGGIAIDHNANPVTWADANYRGPGTVIASRGVYDGGLHLSDQLFDRYFEVDEGWGSSTPGSGILGLPSLENYLRTERHLPDMPSGSTWRRDGLPSLGTLQTGLWRTWETHALYIVELEKQLHALEAKIIGEDLSVEDAARLAREVKRNKRLTAVQKEYLLKVLTPRSKTGSKALTDPTTAP